MKYTMLLLALSTFSANAAITISGGTAVTNARNQLGTASVPTGSLALLIVDTGNNGFFNFGALANGSTRSSAADPLIDTTFASLNIGGTFGGEFVLNRLATGTGSISTLLTNISVADYLNKAFAVVWFDGLASTVDGNAAVGSKWGVVRGSDWVFPASDSGTFTLSGTDANGAASYYQVNANVPAANASNFRTTLVDGTTGAAAFTIVGVPEPSAALLGAIGVLGLLRRRRI